MTPSALSNETLDELLAAAAKATPGPWVRDVIGSAVLTIATEARDEEGSRTIIAQPPSVVGWASDEAFHDATYIAKIDPQTLTALITELLSYRSEGVTVKPLEWVEDGTSAWRAKTIIGDYMAFDQLVRASVVLPARWFPPGNIPTDAETIEDAKAAAQLDYATRIKSTLSLSTERAETIEECARVADEMSFQWSISHDDKAYEVAAEKIADAIRALNPRDGRGQ